MLSYSRASALVAEYGIPVAPAKLVATAEEAVRAAAAFAPQPVALKVISAKLIHKSDAGMVHLGVRGEDEVRSVAAGLLARAPAADREGLLVQRMVSGGCEVIAGALVDAQFGPVVAFGPGGIFVELLGGVDFLKPPFGQAEALQLIHRNAMNRILAGARGRAPADVNALADCLVRMGSLISARRAEIRSIDINPLVVLEEAQGVLALDFRVEEAQP